MRTLPARMPRVVTTHDECEDCHRLAEQCFEHWAEDRRTLPTGITFVARTEGQHLATLSRC